jgi:hypothetical protein
MTTTTRIARITGILLPDGTALRFDGAQAVIEEVTEPEDDGAPVEGDAAHLAPLVTVPGALAAPPTLEPAPARVARGTSPPETARSRAVVRADVRRGGFQADVSDPRLAGRRVLSRKWKGETIRVVVDRTHGGFIFDGKLWPSLSSIARRVCGHSRNGWEWFGLSARGGN